jgi:transglutaminase-like putative cysteine protease
MADVNQPRIATMKHIQILHRTEYHYRVPVTLGPHRAMIRPREGHDVHIERASLQIEPQADVHWLRDIHCNSIAVITFSEPTQQLRVLSDATVALYDDNPVECLLEPNATLYPFQYSAGEQIEIVPYRLPSYPHGGPAVQNWLLDLYRPGQLVNTWELLSKLNARIFEAFKYNYRPEYGVQLPCQTLALGTGSCRDYAVFMMEAARHWGFAARFVSATFRWPKATWRHARLDRDLPSRRGLVGLRSDEQQACWRRAYPGRGGSRARQSLATFRHMERAGRRF